MKRLFGAWGLIAVLASLCSGQGFTGRLHYDPWIFGSEKEYLWTVKAQKFAELKNYPKAFELFGRAVRANPRSSARYWQGLAREKAASETVSAWARARRKLGRNAAGKPWNLPGPDEAAVREHYRQAARDYALTLEVFPVAAVHYQLGKAALDLLGDLKRAEDHLALAVNLNPDEPAYRAALARWAVRSKHLDMARQEAENLLQLDSAAFKAQAHFILGRVELEQKNYFRSIQWFESCLSLDPAVLQTHFYLAQAFEETQQTSLASRHYGRFLRSFTPATLEELEQIEEAQGALARAQERQNE